jgi:hypothetical protein
MSLSLNEKESHLCPMGYSAQTEQGELKWSKYHSHPIATALTYWYGGTCTSCRRLLAYYTCASHRRAGRRSRTGVLPTKERMEWLVPFLLLDIDSKSTEPSQLTLISLFRGNVHIVNWIGVSPANQSVAQLNKLIYPSVLVATAITCPTCRRTCRDSFIFFVGTVLMSRTFGVAV